MPIAKPGQYFVAVEDPRCSGEVERRLVEVQKQQGERNEEAGWDHGARRPGVDWKRNVARRGLWRKPHRRRRPGLRNGQEPGSRQAAPAGGLSASLAGAHRLRTAISTFSRTERWDAAALYSLWAKDRLAM